MDLPSEHGLSVKNISDELMPFLLILWCAVPWLIACSKILQLTIYSERNGIFSARKSYWIVETLRVAKARREVDPMYERLYLSAKKWVLITIIWWGVTFLIIAIFAMTCIIFFQ